MYANMSPIGETEHLSKKKSPQYKIRKAVQSPTESRANEAVAPVLQFDVEIFAGDRWI